ncbi:shootin-1 [Biomphalaria glabrata]|uniref:Shootin-1-like n=1 Tax=Biomphalaria glabrata TaxID=6526 RepID=A0A9W3AZV6_BIOGL|nr:shootin-1-like [Biomphalaria glabrata]XP_055892746.1 shootin-1-like [Biomphalaria glabrata]KAI8769981.1 shootin-1-like; partial [Biomphalaria glabrata]KAI8774690.1 shootin-1 [Biomphalaria glabrata]
MTDNLDSIDFWKNKCKELEKVIKTLSNHCLKVVEKHEELLVNYKKNQDQYSILLQRLKEKGDQIKKAKEVLGPVTQEYEALKEKYEIAVRCQYEAENFASKVNNKNKILKRQSQMLLDKLTNVNIVDINIDDENDKDNEEENEYIKKLNQQVEELEEQSSSLGAELKTLKEDYELEKGFNQKLKEKVESLKAKVSQLKKANTSQEETLGLLAKTSEKAFLEYQELRKQFENEITDRTAVEKIAHNLYAEREAARRQSAMLMKDIGADKKLMEALIQNEDLTTKLETTKKDLEYKIQILEEQLAAENNSSAAQMLENENSSLAQERDALLQRLSESEKNSEQLRAQYSLLMKKYEELESKYERAVAPPPPPPPPPPQMSKPGSFLSRITGGGRKKQREIAQKRLQLGGAAVNVDYSKAVDEMMKRIQSGNISLRPVLKKRTQSCPEEEETSAMSELQSILGKMKKARSEDDLIGLDEPTFDEDSELGRTFKRIQARQGPDVKPKPLPRKLSTIKDEPDDISAD